MFNFDKPLDSVLIKPAGPDCNMNCKYCFYLKKSDLFKNVKSHRMSEEILEEIIKQMMSDGEKEVNFAWQGGEPTLMGLPFFEKAVNLQEKYGTVHTIGNGLQTNGILIDKNWAKFLKNYYFLVGLSLEGPEHIHDRYRVMKDGTGSWSKVESTAKLLLDNDVSVNALILLNDYSVQFPEEIYEYHKSLGLMFMQFIPCVETYQNEILPFSVNPKDYGKALIKLFDLWTSDFINGQPGTSIRFFQSVLYTYVGAIPPECTLMIGCGNYVVVEYNGNVYSCDFFVEDKWLIGNVKENRIADMLRSHTQNKFGQIKEELPDECRNCRWLKHCSGGCPKNRIINVSSGKLNYLCPAFKMFFEHSDEKFKAIAEEWRRKIRKNDIKKKVHELIKKKGIKVGRNSPCPCGSGKKFKFCCGKK